MINDLERLVRALEEDAQRLKAGELSPVDAAKLAEKMAANAGEAVRALDAAIRDPGPRPDPPGQEKLAVDALDGEAPLEPLS